MRPRRRLRSGPRARREGVLPCSERRISVDVLLQVPDDIVETLRVRWADLPRRAVELLAAESYRSGVLTTAEVQRMLGFETRMQTDEFLKNEKAYLDYSGEDFQQDMETLGRRSGDS